MMDVVVHVPLAQPAHLPRRHSVEAGLRTFHFAHMKLVSTPSVAWKSGERVNTHGLVLWCPFLAAALLTDFGRSTVEPGT